MYNYREQNYIKVERGVECMNYQKEVTTLTCFFGKKLLEDPKMRKLRKKAKKTKKPRNMCQF